MTNDFLKKSKIKGTSRTCSAPPIRVLPDGDALDVFVCPAFDKDEAGRDRGRVLRRTQPHEGRLAEAALSKVHVRARGDEDLQRLGRAVSRGARVEEPRDDCGIAVLGETGASSRKTRSSASSICHRNVLVGERSASCGYNRPNR